MSAPYQGNGGTGIASLGPDGQPLAVDPNTGAPMDPGAIPFNLNAGQGGGIQDELLRRFQMQQEQGYGY